MREHPSNLTAKQPIGNPIDALLPCLCLKCIQGNVKKA